MELMAATVLPGVESGMEFEGKVAGPCVFVLFGAAGDLTKRKLAPWAALCRRFAAAFLFQNTRRF